MVPSEKDLPILFYRLILFKIFYLFKSAPYGALLYSVYVYIL